MMLDADILQHMAGAQPSRTSAKVERQALEKGTGFAQGAKENYTEVRPRVISDNRPQFIARTSKDSFGSRE